MIGKEIIQEEIDDNCRKHTFAFKHPLNDHVYISLESETVAKFVCSWIGAVSDCCILHSPYRKSPFKIFKQDDILLMSYKIDEEARTVEHDCDEAEMKIVGIAAMRPHWCKTIFPPITCKWSMNKIVMQSRTP